MTSKSLMRLSYDAGIYKGLGLLLESESRQARWIRIPQQELGGASALELLQQADEQGLKKVRQYIDANAQV